MSSAGGHMQVISVLQFTAAAVWPTCSGTLQNSPPSQNNHDTAPQRRFLDLSRPLQRPAARPASGGAKPAAAASHASEACSWRRIGVTQAAVNASKSTPTCGSANSSRYICNGTARVSVERRGAQEVVVRCIVRSTGGWHASRSCSSCHMHEASGAQPGCHRVALQSRAPNRQPPLPAGIRMSGQKR